MLRKKVLATLAVLFALDTGAQAAPADGLSANVPLNSPLYGYIEKFDGLGYLRSMPTGTKPYTRIQMAKWLTEIHAQERTRPIPSYLTGAKKDLERELAPELQVIAGQQTEPSVSIKELRLEIANYRGNTFRYRANANSGPRAGYQPLNSNNNGYHYGQDGNFVSSAFITGKPASDLVIALEPRFSYDNDQNGNISLISGYIKTRINGTAIQIGKDPLFWGHGATGSLILGNNMEPLTSIRISNIDPYRSRGLFRFLGDINVTAFYSKLEDNRTSLSTQEVNNPSFVGFRGDFTPAKNFTFGLSFSSMVGGTGRGLSGGDYWDWLVGRNDDVARDKWNNIAGLDFKVRMPCWNGTQIYGEIYGEDQANYMPSLIAERIGIYFPRLNADGKWDMKLEYAKTNKGWYAHQLYTNGYVYKGNIMGDPLGHNACQIYMKVGHYLDSNSQISLNMQFAEMDREAAVRQKIASGWLQYQTQLRHQLQLMGTLGLVKVKNADFASGNDDTGHFVSVALRWVY